MEKSRILHCPIGTMNVGGIENMLIQLYRHIDREKIQFDFVTHDYSENYYEKEILSMGGRLFRVPYVSRNPIKHIRDFHNLLKSHPEYKVIHIHTTYAIMYIDALIAKKNGRTVIVHSHNSNATKLHAIIHRILKKKLSQIADYRFACSYIAGEWMFDKEFPYEIWKNGIDLNPFRFNGNTRARIRAELGLSGNELLIGNVARLSYQKNQELLLEIFADYIKVNPCSRLILVGDGEDRRMLEVKANKLGINGKVVFAGNVKNVNEYLMAIDVFCLTSRWEGFGISMVEAAAAGVVIVAVEKVDMLIKELENVNIVHDVKNILEWVDKIQAIKTLGDADRVKCFAKVDELGYGIYGQAKWAVDFYQRLGKNCIYEIH